MRRRQRFATAAAAAAAAAAEDGAPPAKRQRVPSRRQRRQLPLLRAARERPEANLEEGEGAATLPAAKSFWLETHVWHTKRMQMQERWGYVVPWHRNDLGVRAAHRAAATSTTAHDRSYAPPLQLRAAAAGPGEPTGLALLHELLEQCGYGSQAVDKSGQQALRLQKFFLRWPAAAADSPRSETAQTGTLIAPAEALFLPAAGVETAVDGQAADADARVWLWLPPEAAAEARHCLGAAASALSRRLGVDPAAMPLTFSRFEVAGSSATSALGSIVRGGVPALTTPGTDGRETSEQEVVAVQLTPERTAPTEAAAAEIQQAVTEAPGPAAQPPHTSELSLVGVLRALRGFPARDSVALFIRRPGLFSSAASRASWEVLVPKGAGAAVWQRLVVQCKARALGRCAA
eukprot:COSAG03_NODE_1916_length_3355_cov_4.159091_2_plen_404_part_00